MKKHIAVFVACAVASASIARPILASAAYVNTYPGALCAATDDPSDQQFGMVTANGSFANNDLSQIYISCPLQSNDSLAQSNSGAIYYYANESGTTPAAVTAQVCSAGESGTGVPTGTASCGTSQNSSAAAGTVGSITNLDTSTYAEAYYNFIYVALDATNSTYGDNSILGYGISLDQQ
jgi:hypothetical protein